MSTPISLKTLAFFGATGDCAGHCLAAALSAGHTCNALARTPSKLTDSLTAKGVSLETQAKLLTITQGDIRDVKAVERVLCVKTRHYIEEGGSTVVKDTFVDMIISGAGAPPQMTWNPLNPFTIADPKICQDAITTIITAVDHVRKEQFLQLRSNDCKPMPQLVLVSTTGTSPPSPRGGACKRDVPLALSPLYHWMGQVPHGDKKVMEAIVRKDMSQADVRDVFEGKEEAKDGVRAFKSYVFVRPSLLMDGEGKGLDSVRVGVDDEPALGWTITRSDVGRWMYEKLVKPQEWPAAWKDTGVTLTT